MASPSPTEPRGLQRYGSSDISEDGDGDGVAGLIRSFFDQIDLDGDGSITLADFARSLATFGIQGDPQALFNSLDVDGDGTVTFPEFEQHAPAFMSAVAAASGQVRAPSALPTAAPAAFEAAAAAPPSALGTCCLPAPPFLLGPFLICSPRRRPPPPNAARSCPTHPPRRSIMPRSWTSSTTWS